MTIPDLLYFLWKGQNKAFDLRNTDKRGSVDSLISAVESQILYRAGYDDRVAGCTPLSTGNTYLAGYNSDEGGLCCITRAQLEWLAE